MRLAEPGCGQEVTPRILIGQRETRPPAWLGSVEPTELHPHLGRPDGPSKGEQRTDHRWIFGLYQPWVNMTLGLRGAGRV
jgi:hypothetical protein